MFCFRWVRRILFERRHSTPTPEPQPEPGTAETESESSGEESVAPFFQRPQCYTVIPVGIPGPAFHYRGQLNLLPSFSLGSGRSILRCLENPW